jgi:hypothetical protein
MKEEALGTYAIPAWKYLQITIITRYEHLLDAVESYQRLRAQGKRNPPLYSVHSRFCALFWSVKSSLKADNEETHNKLLEIATFENGHRTDNKELFKAIGLLDEFLYSKGLRKYDSEREMADEPVTASAYRTQSSGRRRGYR